MGGKGMGVLSLGIMVVLSVLVINGKAETQSYLIDCGSDSTINVDGIEWIGDLASGSNITLSSEGISASTGMYDGDSTFAPLYQTARFFTENLNYTVKMIPGNYLLRLHFYPFSFQSYNVNDSSFGVKANGFKLVSEFNVPDEILRKNSNWQSAESNSSAVSLFKEYFLSVDLDVLVIEFTPFSGKFGFVSAIEIILADNTLFGGSVSKLGGAGAGGFSNLSRRAIETMYRLNVGGSLLKPSQDQALRRLWELDSSYMITANAGSEMHNNSNVTYASTNETSYAPLLVYETARAMSNNEVADQRFNMSWKFDVHPDFDYLVRLHFCELSFDKANQRIFRIFINNRTAANNFDVFVKAGGANKAYHQDYLDILSSKINTLWIQLGPASTSTAAGTDAILNGLEIFKLSRNGNLAYVQHASSITISGNKKSSSFKLGLGIGAGIVSVALLGVLVVIIFAVRKRCRNVHDSEIKDNASTWRPLSVHGSALDSTANAREPAGSLNLHGSTVPSRVGKRFSLAEIRVATKDFDESLVIGVGGFGKVYKGEIEGSLTAIKRAHPNSQQGLTEFETEIEMLSKLRHRHLVSLIGFCEDQNEMILVYEYMANGTLRSHLFGSENPPLTWKQRLEVCIGAARGLHYLHTGSDLGIIHRDVKTTNILLDENFVAKMADFGLSKTGPSLEHTHVSTAVKGSFGYLDPEYYRRQQLTEKSDVYSFGVVLFEVVCARAVINPSLPKDQINLAEWAMRWQRQRSLETIIDPHLKGNYCSESLLKFGEVAEKCLADEGKSRPTMGEVLWHLEYVLQLQDAWIHTKRNNAKSQILDHCEEEDEKLELTNLNEVTDLDKKPKEDGQSFA